MKPKEMYHKHHGIVISNDVTRKLQKKNENKETIIVLCGSIVTELELKDFESNIKLYKHYNVKSEHNFYQKIIKDGMGPTMRWASNYYSGNLKARYLYHKKLGAVTRDKECDKLQAKVKGFVHLYVKYGVVAVKVKHKDIMDMVSIADRVGLWSGAVNRFRHMCKTLGLRLAMAWAKEYMKIRNARCACPGCENKTTNRYCSIECGNEGSRKSMPSKYADLNRKYADMLVTPDKRTKAQKDVELLTAAPKPTKTCRTCTRKGKCLASSYEHYANSKIERGCHAKKGEARKILSVPC